MNFVEVIYKHLMGVLGHHKKKDIIGLRDTDSPTFAGLTVTGVADLSVEIKNMIVVDESVQNIAGVSYKTWALADAWITANVTPSRTNVWGIEIHGTNAEDVIVRAWVTIQGMASTILTGNVTFGGVDYTYYNAYTIKDCTLNNFTGGGLGTATGVLRRCEMRGGTSTTVFCILADCWVVEWTSTTLLFTAYFFCSIYGVGAGVIMDPTTVMINGYITNADISGGIFTNADIASNDFSLDDDLELRNCYLEDDIDASTSSTAVIVSLLNSTINSETITIGTGNTLFTGGDITGLSIDKDGGTWLKGNGYFTDVITYGASLFNAGSLDKDWTLNKNTSGVAIKYDAGNDTTQIGLAGTNYSEFEANGMLEFNGTATVWKDINMGSAQLSRPSSSQPDIESFVDEAGADTGIETYGFAVGEKVHGSFEIQHDYKQGSDFTFHVHWQGITAPSGTDNVQWRLTYTAMRDGATLDAVTAVDSPDATIDTQYMAVRSDFNAITGTNYLIGDQFLFTLERVASTGDAYAGDALIATAGIHYEIDTVGSRLISTK